NVATIIDREDDKDPDDNEEEVEIVLPDLGVTKKIVDPKQEYKVNDVLAFEIKVSNNASAAQTNINVREQLPKELEYVRHTVTNGATYDAGTGILNIPTLA